MRENEEVKGNLHKVHSEEEQKLAEFGGDVVGRSCSLQAGRSGERLCADTEQPLKKLRMQEMKRLTRLEGERGLIQGSGEGWFFHHKRDPPATGGKGR